MLAQCTSAQAPYFPFLFFVETDTFGPFFVEYTFTFPTLAKNPIHGPPFLIDASSIPYCDLPI